MRQKLAEIENRQQVVDLPDRPLAAGLLESIPLAENENTIQSLLGCLWAASFSGDRVDVGFGAVRHMEAYYTFLGDHVSISATTTYIGYRFTLATHAITLVTAANANDLVNDTGSSPAYLEGVLHKVTAHQDGADWIVDSVQPWQLKTVLDKPDLSDDTPLACNSPAAAGTALSASRKDHVHAYTFSGSTPSAVDGGAAAAGSEALPARGDHKHNFNYPYVTLTAF